MKHKIFLTFNILFLSSCASLMGDKGPMITPIAETVPVGVAGDAADDPAIWLSKDGMSSRIIGTQKKGGIYLYNLQGEITQEILGGKPNNIDIRNDFAWSENLKAPIIVTSDRIDNAAAVYRFDEAKKELETNPILRINSGFAEIYGICIGNFAGQTLIGATSKIGEFKLFKIENNNGLNAKLIGQTALGSISEGCVFDDEKQRIYVSQELVGIWQLSINGDVLDKKLIDDVKSPYLKADIEGLSIWKKDGKAYLIASVQGKSQFAIYDILSEPKYLKNIKISANPKFDRVTTTDGLDVHSGDFGIGLNNGIMVVQDDKNTNPSATQNFKIIDFNSVLNSLN